MGRGGSGGGVGVGVRVVLVANLQYYVPISEGHSSAVSHALLILLAATIRVVEANPQYFVSCFRRPVVLCM